jgi:hypothetical protein
MRLTPEETSPALSPYGFIENWDISDKVAVTYSRQFFANVLFRQLSSHWIKSLSKPFFPEIKDNKQFKIANNNVISRISEAKEKERRRSKIKKKRAASEEWTLYGISKEWESLKLAEWKSILTVPSQFGKQSGYYYQKRCQKGKVWVLLSCFGRLITVSYCKRLSKSLSSRYNAVSILWI